MSARSPFARFAPRFTTALAVGATLALTACGSDEADDSSSAGTGATGSAGDFAEAIPESQALALTLDDTGSDETEAADAAPSAEHPRLRGLTRGVFERINALREEAHARVDTLLEGVEPETYSEGNVECRRWSTDNEAETVHWVLTSCRRDAKNRHYAFALKGRPIDAGDDALVPVMAGEGKVVARFDDRKRGHGRIGFDFDAYAALTGREGPAGQLGIGFRSVGPVRQLNVALRDVARAGDETPVSGLYRFKHIQGTGGRVTLLAHGDLLTADDAGALSLGEDGLEEHVRVALAWRRGLGARAVAAACGGSVGEGECARVVQCWRADGEVSAEETADPETARRERPRFDGGQCAPAPVGLDEVEDTPAPEDFELPEGEALPEEPAPADGE
jgi:hypothetical protein